MVFSFAGNIDSKQRVAEFADTEKKYQSQVFAASIAHEDIAILALTLLLSRPQIDLEPEGKVFVVIDLTGSSSEGRKSPPLLLLVFLLPTPCILIRPPQLPLRALYRAGGTWFQTQQLWCQKQTKDRGGSDGGRGNHGNRHITARHSKVSPR